MTILENPTSMKGSLLLI